MKRKRKFALFGVAAVFAFSALFAGCSPQSTIPPDSGITVEPNPPEIPEQKVPVITLSVTKYVAPVSTVNAATEAYMQSDFSVTIDKTVNKFRPNGERLDMNAPVVIDYALNYKDDYTGGVRAVSAVAYLWERNSPNEKVRCDFGSGKRVYFYNLKIDTTYDYRVTVLLSNGETLTESNSFTTADTPRILWVDGIWNVRDIGGWKTADGVRIRQGYLYRGTELDGRVEAGYVLTDYGKKQMLDTLNIRTDMDLRARKDDASEVGALGADVPRKYYDFPYYSGIFKPEGQKIVKSVFSDLAKPETYPVYLHCTYGTDRTGTVCMLLEALLGLSEEDIVREYELTGLWSSGVTRNNFGTFLTDFKKLPGNTLKEKAENYLLSVGLTQEEIDSIRSILLEVNHGDET